MSDKDRIAVVSMDITQVEVDAIVNAANRDLVAGGGVDGAIHRAAGFRLQLACKKYRGCPTGEARVTEGFDLKASYVIHTVGPIWRGGDSDEDALLASCYRNSLLEAARLDLATVAFPSISTGAYRFPLQRAARIAVMEVKSFLATHPRPEKVFHVCFGPGVLEAYQAAVAEAWQGSEQM